jgi:hypothetical protein
MESIETDYQVSKSTVCQSIQWVEDTVKRDETFKLPGKKVLTGTPQEIKCVVVDVTESLIERPQKTKSVLFREKEGAYHKTQVIINRKNRQIVDIQQEKAAPTI